MALARRQHAAPTPVAPATPSAAWLQWPVKVQALQFEAAKEMLGVFSRHVAALVAVEAGRLCSGRPARDS